MITVFGRKFEDRRPETEDGSYTSEKKSDKI